MKILYLAPAMADYQSDALFHGLHCLDNVEVVDLPKQEHMYIGGKVPEYGRGFTLYNLLPDVEVDRSEIATRIQRGEFDVVIYAGDYVHHDDPYPFENIVRRYVPPGAILIIDGSDSPIPAKTERRAWGTYYKRENASLADTHQIGIPISFAIPEEKLRCGVWPRDRHVALYKPGETYRYDVEWEYYDGYATAAFAHTCKKAGWDCLRHYEIMATGCIPIFAHVDEMPPYTCTTLPRAALERVAREWQTMDDETIAAVGRQIFEWCRARCTTKVLAGTVLGTRWDVKYRPGLQMGVAPR